VLEWVREPWHAALIAGLLGILLFGSGTGAAVRNRGGRGRRKGAVPAPQPKPARARVPGRGVIAHAWQPTAVVGVIGLVAFTALGAVAHAVPATKNVPTEKLYSQSGHFSYGATVPVSAAYPSGHVASGEAVFPRLVHRLDVGFTWRFDSAQPHVVHGTASLAADISDGQGWRRRIELAPRSPFAGDRLTRAGTLRLDALEAMLRRLEAVTGTHGGTYQVSIVPTVKLAGVLDGGPLTDMFAPPLQLSLDQVRLQVAASPDPTTPNSLVRSKETGGMLTQPNQLRLVAGRRLALRPAERIALMGVAASLVVLLLALALRIARPRPSDEAARLRGRYSRWIVRVADASSGSRVVDVNDFEDLARIAERYGRLILQDERTDAFLVEDEGVSYRWQQPPRPMADALGRIADVVAQREPTAPLPERRSVDASTWSKPEEDSQADELRTQARPER
jgi:hypothetical protein